jgi:hypothetical protein
VKEVRILDVSKDGIGQRPLPIPIWRRLAQLRTSRAELEEALAGFNPDAGELGTWVEVVVEDATLEDDLVARVTELTEERDFEVLKVLRGKTALVAAMSAGEATDDEAIESLLDQPTGVFEHLLEQHEELEDSEIDALKTTFAMLVEMHQEQQTVEAS